MTHESTISYYSKLLANDKDFYRQKDKQTGQKLYAPDLWMRVHEKNKTVTVVQGQHVEPA